MKKNGFTLAEVLITLAIIGVVATMTLPALITNTGEQQAKTGLKKAINTLAEAAQMSSAIAGYDFSNLSKEVSSINNSDADEEQSMASLLRTRTVVDYTTTEEGEVNPTPNAGARNKNYIGTPDRFVTLRDGVILMYTTSDTTKAANQKLADDGLPVGFVITVDTNGTKGPNTLSNCKEGGGTKAGANDATVEASVCNNKKNRVINDRFQVKLKGTRVEPYGAAATWAMQN